MKTPSELLKRTTKYSVTPANIMIKTVFLTLVATVAGFIAAFLLVVGVELFSSVVHPLPSDFGGTKDEMCRHVERYPQWVLAAVVPMWGLAAFVGTWLAQRIGNLVSASIVGLLLVAAVAFNASMLPYPSWFKIANLVMIPLAIFVGSRLARPGTAPIGQVEGRERVTN